MGEKCERESFIAAIGDIRPESTDVEGVTQGALNSGMLSRLLFTVDNWTDEEQGESRTED